MFIENSVSFVIRRYNFNLKFDKQYINILSKRLMV